MPLADHICYATDDVFESPPLFLTCIFIVFAHNVLLEADTHLPWGVETSYLRFDAGRYGITLFDLMVGEPVAYATGLRLKATGIVKYDFPTPRSPRGQ